MDIFQDVDQPFGFDLGTATPQRIDENVRRNEAFQRHVVRRSHWGNTSRGRSCRREPRSNSRIQSGYRLCHDGALREPRSQQHQFVRKRARAHGRHVRIDHAREQVVRLLDELGCCAGCRDHHRRVDRHPRCLESIDGLVDIDGVALVFEPQNRPYRPRPMRGRWTASMRPMASAGTPIVQDRQTAGSPSCSRSALMRLRHGRQGWSPRTIGQDRCAGYRGRAFRATSRVKVTGISDLYLENCLLGSG
jgi:hypothetical protein